MPQQDICDFAAKAEQWVQSGNIDGLARDSSWDTRDRRAELASTLAKLGSGKREVVGLGCPMAAVALGCGPTFGIGFSTLERGVDPGPGDSGIVALSYIRDSNCSMAPIYQSGAIPTCAPASQLGRPVLSGSRIPSEPGFRRAVLNGGLAQGDDLAGRPIGIDDTSVRSTWETWSTEPLPPSQAETVAGVPVRALALTQSRPIPSQGMLLIGSGCWGCEGFDSSIDRVYVIGGKVQRDVLLQTSAAISGMAIKPDLSEIVVSVCVHGYCGPLNAVSPDSCTELRRSTDGGVTWQTVATFDGIAQVEGFTPAGLVLVRASGPGDPRDWTDQTVTWPDMTPIARPAGALEGAWPDVQSDGTVTFPTEDRKSLLKPDGSTYWTFALKTPAEYASPLGGPFSNRSVVTWSTTPSAGNTATRNYLGVLDGASLSAVYNEQRYIYTSTWLARNALISSVDASPADLSLSVDQNMRDYRSPFPSVVDLDQGTVAPIAPQFFLDTYGPTSRKMVIGYASGPFVRIKTGNDCLNVRDQPSPSALSLGCFANGVLLRVRGVSDQHAEGITWVAVETPHGRAGWASGEFLER